MRINNPKQVGFAPVLAVILIGTVLLGGIILLLLSKNPFSKEPTKSDKSEEFKLLGGKKVDPSLGVKSMYEPYLPREIGNLTIIDLLEKDSSAYGLRFVKTKDGEKEISLIEGYRAIYALPSGENFANVHIDKSASKSYEEDKKNAVDGMRFTWKGEKHLIQQLDYSGIEYYIGKLYIGTSVASPEYSLIEQAIIFFLKDRVIVTIYFLFENLEDLKTDNPQVRTMIQEQGKLQESLIKRIIESVGEEKM